MKKIIFYSAFLLIVFTSCKKENVAPAIDKTNLAIQVTMIPLSYGEAPTVNVGDLVSLTVFASEGSGYGVDHPTSLIFYNEATNAEISRVAFSTNTLIPGSSITITNGDGQPYSYYVTSKYTFTVPATFAAKSIKVIGIIDGVTAPYYPIVFRVR